VATKEEARAAQDRLVAMAKACEVFGVYGAGIVGDGKGGYVVAVNLASDDTVLVPMEIDGVPLQAAFVSKPRAY
jgi:hypothetical protein